MKICVTNSETAERIVEGNFDSVEAGNMDGKPSLHVHVGSNPLHEISFFCESDEELDKFINNLQEAKKRNS